MLLAVISYLNKNERSSKQALGGTRWLDAQGHELAILQGATNILKTVTVLYTEVNFIHAYKDQPLYDEIKSWLILILHLNDRKVEK